MKRLLKSNLTLFFLIMLSAGVMCFYLSKSIMDVGRYTLLNGRSKAFITGWQIDEEKEGEYIVGATYDFDIDGKKHQGQKMFNERKFFNYYAALDAIIKLSKQDLHVWYSSKNHNLSELNFHFKVKNLVYFFLSFSLLFYFVLIAKRIKKCSE